MTKTIFFPGKALTSAWLNSSQYLGPSNPGVVFKANPINDFEFPLLKGDSLDLQNLSGYFLSTTINQTVGGLKTFTAIPTVPTATATSGLQVVNIDYLNSAAGNAVKLTGNQTISGVKNFSDLQTPAGSTNSALPESVVNIDYFNIHAVDKYNTQTINGIKTFTQTPVITNPTIPTHATNKNYVDNLVASLGTATGQNFLKVGNIQVIFGNYNIIGTWSAGGALNTPALDFATVAPGSQPYTAIIGASSCIDRKVTLSTQVTLTNVGFSADEPTTGTGLANDGIIRFMIAGYV